MLERKSPSLERRVHNSLLDEAAGMASMIPDVWNGQKSVPPVAFSWPTTRLRDDAGRLMDGVITMMLDDVPPADHQEALRALVTRTNAFALLLIREKEGHVLATFETRLGSRVWTYRIHRHGDHCYMGREVDAQNDVPATGILWKKP